MDKKGEETRPISVIIGWVVLIAAAIVAMVLIANNFGLIDFDILSGVNLG